MDRYRTVVEARAFHLGDGVAFAAQVLVKFKKRHSQTQLRLHSTPLPPWRGEQARCPFRVFGVLMKRPGSIRIASAPIRLPLPLLVLALLRHQSRRRSRNRDIQLVDCPQRGQRLVKLAYMAHHQHRHLIAM